MKAVLVLFDTLNRRALAPYGAEERHTPNFARLAGRATTFDSAFVGSMPCIPARRELHTGRSNFLHRSWGPLEPFDDSMPEMLGSRGIHAHLVTDHYHYFEDGGAGYHTRYSTWELIRGQAGDPWKAVVGFEPPDNHFGAGMFGGHWQQEWINREKLGGVAPQEQTFDLGLEFLERNRDEDNWFLQIETFDPHEPFWLSEAELAGLDDEYDGPDFLWPPYRPVQETDEEVRHLQRRYGAMIKRCDRQLGRVLDFFDAHDLWSDTLLIVGTDHGLLLGEHGWWGKTGPRSKTGPEWFNEIAHVPLLVAAPARSKGESTREESGHQTAGSRDERLVSMVDLPATLLDWFGVDRPADMQGRSLLPETSPEPIREGLLFGSFGAHVNVTDGRYVYMRGATPENSPLHEYTLMPVGLPGRASPEVLAEATLHPPFTFTKGAPVLKLPVPARLDISKQPSALFDCSSDPHQTAPLDDPVQEHRLLALLDQLMRDCDAPPEQYLRLGLAEREDTADTSGRTGTSHRDGRRNASDV